MSLATFGSKRSVEAADILAEETAYVQSSEAVATCKINIYVSFFVLFL
jgi:hypothetical protein